MRNMLLLLFLVFDPATAFRDGRINLEQNLMALKDGYELRGNIPLVKNITNMVPGLKRVVMPFYINTYYCWIHFYSKCPPEGKTKQIIPEKKEPFNKSGKIRIL